MCRHRGGRPHQGLLVRHRIAAGAVNMDDKLNILVIDDSVDDRTLYRRALMQALGGRLHFAEEASGESGLVAVAKAEPTCVLLDYSLPGQNGIEVLKRIR